MEHLEVSLGELSKEEYFNQPYNSLNYFKFNQIGEVDQISTVYFPFWNKINLLGSFYENKKHWMIESMNLYTGNERSVQLLANSF